MSMTAIAEAEFKLRVSRTVSDLRAVDLSLLAEGLWCPACDVPLSLKHCHRERRSVFCSTLWVSCVRCAAVRELSTLRTEDRAKPLDVRQLANAKRLSFVSPAVPECPPNTLEKENTDLNVKISRKRKLTLQNSSQIKKLILSQVSEEPDTHQICDTGRKQEFRADHNKNEALLSTGQAQEPVSCSISDTGVHQEDEDFDWDEPFVFGSSSDSDDEAKVDSEEELFDQAPIPNPPPPLFCEYCLEHQESIKKLRAHYKEHPQYAAFECGWCGLKLDEVKAFERHRRNIHQIVGQYHLCHLCGRLCPFAHQFRLHMQGHDSGRAIKCPHCNWTFRTQACLRKHMSNHVVEHAICCEHCPKKFKTMRHIKEHIRLHIPGLHFKCKYCKTVYGRKFPYREHMENCHRFVCPLCLREFGTVELVRKHRTETHTCEELERSRLEGDEEFIKKTNYQCSHCHKYLYDPKSLRHHVRAVHLDPNSGYDINRRLLSYKPKNSGGKSEEVT